MPAITSSARLTLRQATPDDLPAVLSLLCEAAQWLHANGVRQWPIGGFPAARIEPLIASGTLYVLSAGHVLRAGYDLGEGMGVPAATVALDDNADPEFWQSADQPAGASYVHKLAVSRSYAGRGLGEVLLDWAGARAAAEGKTWLRLDCAKDNHRLQAYYSGLGFRHVRTVDLPHRASGALFERPALVHEPGGWRTSPQREPILFAA